MRLRKLTPTTLAPTLLLVASGWSVALPLLAEDVPAQTAPPAPPAEITQLKADRETPGTAANRAAVEADALFVEALAQFRQGNRATALKLVERAVELDPDHAGARKLRTEVRATLGDHPSSVAVTAERFSSQQQVHHQEVVVRLTALRDNGKRKMDAGDFAGAELDFDRVEVAIKAGSDLTDWGSLPAEVAGLRREARARAEMQALRDQEKARKDAMDRTRAAAELQEQSLARKVDELLRRAKTAYDRKDYRRAEVDAWNAYELDRRREDARKLYLDARRQGHVAFDKRLREDRLEAVTRVQEDIHRSLIPQNDLLLYPEDWQRRSLRTTAELGAHQVELWRQQLTDRLEQRITVDFQEQPFEEVIAFLRQVTGANIIVSPTALANSPPPVTLKVKDMKFGDALKWILELTQLHYALQDQAIFISNDIVVGSIILKIYDVTDLTMPIPDFPGKDMGFGGGTGGGGGGGFALFGGGGAGADAPKTGPTPDELITFIQDNVAKGTWDPAKGTSIEQRQGAILFVSQTPEVHAQVERLLTDMRNRRALQVNIDVRMLDTRKGYWEEIGVEYHNNPTGIIASSSSNGYTRLNDTLGYNGSTFNNLPGNQTILLNSAYAANSRSYNNSTRGMVLESSLRPFNFFNVDQLNAIISAVEEESDQQILQNPTITCFNNQRATASFLVQFAYIADYDIVGNNLDPRIEILSFGNTIDIKPIISQDRKFITLEVNPTSTEFGGSFTEQLVAPRVLQTGDGAAILGQQPFPLELPNSQTRALRSTSLLPDRASLLVGSYTNAMRQRTHMGIPFLSHIPFLGRLFSRNGIYDESRQLSYLITGRILELGGEEAKQ